MSHPLPDMMSSSMGKIREMIDVNTIIGDPITTPEGVTIIPVSKVSLALPAEGRILPQRISPKTRTMPLAAAAAQQLLLRQSPF